ncbi:alpha/beta hydrolase [Fusibacter sp. JL216-2]|uniref:alpha/beta hydrolase n=1 Tax=Fusibacter sp. JL216-2 TaxID=3071453 RepID=UPI003D3248A3
MQEYNGFHRKLQNYCLGGHPEMVLEMLKEGMDKYPKHLSEMLFEGIMACIELDQHESALTMMKLADSQGFWYPTEMFPEEKGYELYTKKWHENRGRVSQASMQVGYENGLNMLALHGWGEDLSLFRRYFHSDGFEKRGRIHYLQSSQKIGDIQYVWNDRKQAEHDVRHYLTETLGDMKIDILAGFSQGGYLALDFLVHEIIDVDKLILICPGKEDYTLKALTSLAKNGVEVLLISGTQDFDHEYHNNLYERLREADVRVDYQVIEKMGHWFPEDLDKRIDSFI